MLGIKNQNKYSYLRKTTAQIFTFGVAMEKYNYNPKSNTLLPRKIEVYQPIKFYSKDHHMDSGTHIVVYYSKVVLELKKFKNV